MRDHSKLHNAYNTALAAPNIQCAQRVAEPHPPTVHRMCYFCSAGLPTLTPLQR